MSLPHSVLTPKYPVGTRLLVRWEAGEGPFVLEPCTITRILGPIAPKRKRKQGGPGDSGGESELNLSWFRYELRWDTKDSTKDIHINNGYGGGTQTNHSTTRLLHLEHEVVSETGFSPAAHPETGFSPAAHPDPSDHAETPLQAYKHVATLLSRIVASTSKESESDSDTVNLKGYGNSGLRIYDPYFCQGRVISELGKLGFHSVYNRREDFYRSGMWGRVMNDSSNQEQNLSLNQNSTDFNFDALLTNPPYSGDHVAKLFRFAFNCKKPFFLLVPNYFLSSGESGWELRRAVSNSKTNFKSRIFVLAPRRRYVYRSPEELRAGTSTKKNLKEVAPYVSLWVVGNVDSVLGLEKQLQDSPNLSELTDSDCFPLCELVSRSPVGSSSSSPYIDFSRLPPEVRPKTDKAGALALQKKRFHRFWVAEYKGKSNSTTGDGVTVKLSETVCSSKPFCFAWVAGVGCNTKSKKVSNSNLNLNFNFSGDSEDLKCLCKPSSPFSHPGGRECKQIWRRYEAWVDESE